ncbi:hypothetical protein [Streptomyces rimosus]|uniref:hypothetical protein n=1 Tax=Streptomyces rimosus TaxID=1927 RepID=UPI0037D5FC70
MNGTGAGNRSRNLVGAGAAALLVLLAVAVTVGEREPVVVVGDKAPMTTVGGTAPGAGPRLTITEARNTYYIPRYHATPENEPGEYRIALKVGGPQSVKNIKVTIDLSVLKGRASVSWVNKPYKCTLAKWVMTCPLGTIGNGEGAVFTPFALKPEPGAAPGRGGAMNITVTSDNAPTVRHATQVIVGAPLLTARQDAERTGVEPNSEVPLTPAFGNKGDTDVNDGITVFVRAEEATLRPLHSNCRYDKAVAPTKAQCDFPGPLKAGTAYETATPLKAVADTTAMHGHLYYAVFRAHDTLGDTLLPASAPRGSGAPLGLRPVDGGGSDFTWSRQWPSDMSTGELAFDTSQINDLQAIGFTIKGKVGQVVEAQVPYPRNFYSGDMLVTLPEGVSLVTVKPGEHPSEVVYCRPGETANGPVKCYGPEVGGTWVRVRIDKRVEGAKGSVHADSDPATDPNQENNTAPITVEYTG